MTGHLLHKSIQSLAPVSEADWQFISSFEVERSFKKGAFISREGEVNRYTNFIIEGSARVFYIDTDGHEHVIQLGIVGWWVSDFASFITQQKAQLYVEALEPTRVISFSFDSFQLIFEKVPAFERFYRLLIQKAYASFQNRMLQNLSMDAEQRYLNFHTNYPEIDERLSQKHIASYLGMSAEFLSKIKKRVHQKNRSGPGSTTTF